MAPASAGRCDQFRAAGGTVVGANGPVDIVVPSVREGAVLSITLTSMARAADEAGVPRRSIIVADDASSRSLDRRHASQELGLGYVATTGAHGAAAARNAGAGAGTSPWIAFVDDDVELDRPALKRFVDLVTGVDEAPDIVVGGLRPPEGAPRWLSDLYERAVLTPATQLAPETSLRPVDVAAGLLAVRREVFEAASGFPDVEGIEDTLFGLTVGRVHPSVRIVRSHVLTGVHHYVPDWHAWLDRCEATGVALARALEQLEPRERAELLQAHGLGRDLRGALKRALAVVPTGRVSGGSPQLLRRVASAAAEARGFLGAVSRA